MSRFTGAREEIRHRIPAEPGELAELRHSLGRWASEIGMPAERREELVLAAYEALANSVEHAYHGVGGSDGVDGSAAGEVHLHATRGPDGAIVVTVTDHGRWKAPTPSGGLRGRGIPIIRALADHTRITSGDTGTTVTMTWQPA
jgi:serine/threonine-protein kinase RsbW